MFFLFFLFMYFLFFLFRYNTLLNTTFHISAHVIYFNDAPNTFILLGISASAKERPLITVVFIPLGHAVAL